MKDEHVLICNELFTWADVYDTANHDERRAILQQFIKEIRVRKDYEISITLNASFDQVEQLKAVSTYDGAEIFEEISEKGASRSSLDKCLQITVHDDILIFFRTEPQ